MNYYEFERLVVDTITKGLAAKDVNEAIHCMSNYTLSKLCQ